MSRPSSGLGRGGGTVTRAEAPSRDDGATTAGHVGGPGHGAASARTGAGTQPVPALAPSRDDGATVTCPVCRRPFSPSGRALYCSDYCRKKAWQRRHQEPSAPVVVPPAGLPRRQVTVYACESCGTRALGEQRCEGCGLFMAKVGIGGLCPACSEPVAVEELVEGAAFGAAAAPGRGGRG
jgi:hypothetical protein